MITTLGFRSLGSTAALTVLLAGMVRADLTPEWITNLPVGSSLPAGIWGMVVDPAGVTYVTGITGASSNTDVVTAAIRTDGSILWSHVWNGPANWHDQGRGITLGPGGVVYVTGNTPGPGTYANVLLLKYDATNGALLNTIQYSSAPGTSEHGASVVTDTQGGVYVGGGTVGDGGDALILKFDASGVFQWSRVWDGPAQAPYSQDNVLLMRITPTGEPVALIHGVMGSLQPDYVVLKLAAAGGATIWQATWGVSGGDYPTDIEIGASGDIYVTGTGIDWINKYSTIKLRGSDGQLLWQAYDSAAVENSATALALDGQGGVYVTGAADPDGDHSNFNDNFFTVKRDAGTGALLWTHQYGQNCIGCYDIPSDVLVDDAGHVFVAGTTSSPPYSADTITFVLDANTGIETQRGVIPSTSPVTARSGILRFDAAFNLYNGGELYNANTGAVDISVFKYAGLNPPPGVVFCPGDGSGTACPCGNDSSAGSGEGCRNSLGFGAELAATGNASLSGDTLVLSGTQMPNSSALYIQGTSQQAGGAGIVFGDGLRCVGGAVERLGTKPNVAGASQYPASGDPSVSQRGLVTTPGVRTYQVWYRNAAAFCSASTFNLTNGLSVTWSP